MRCGNPVVTNIRKQIQITKKHTPTTSKVSKDDGSIVLSIQIMMFYITGDLSEEMLFYCLLEQSVFGNHFYWDCGHYSQLYVTSSIWKQSPYCSCCTCSVYIITCHQIIQVVRGLLQFISIQYLHSVLTTDVHVLIIILNMYIKNTQKTDI